MVVCHPCLDDDRTHLDDGPVSEDAPLGGLLLAVHDAVPGLDAGGGLGLPLELDPGLFGDPARLPLGRLSLLALLPLLRHVVQQAVEDAGQQPRVAPVLEARHEGLDLLSVVLPHAEHLARERAPVLGPRPQRLGPPVDALQPIGLEAPKRSVPGQGAQEDADDAGGLGHPGLLGLPLVHVQPHRDERTLLPPRAPLLGEPSDAAHHAEASEGVVEAGGEEVRLCQRHLDPLVPPHLQIVGERAVGPAADRAEEGLLEVLVGALLAVPKR